MRVGVLTREYSPDVYAGAGVHVEFLAREPARLVDVEVHCLGAPRAVAVAHADDDPRLAGANPVLRIFAAQMGEAGRERAVAEFGWDVAAQRTLSVYESVGARR